MLIWQTLILFLTVHNSVKPQLNKVNCRHYVPNFYELLIYSNAQVNLKSYILYEFFFFGKNNIAYTCTYKIRNNSYLKYVATLLLILSGDIQLNPGPEDCSCGICNSYVKSDEYGINCDVCHK